jgi:predicted secreted protein
MRSLRSLLALASLSAALAAPGRADTPPPRNQVSFNVSAVREVANDWTTALIGTTASGSDPAELASRVNKIMNDALAVAKSESKVKVTSGAYNTYPEYGDGNRIVRWQASQDLILESADFEAVAKLLGKLQGKGLMLRNISFSVAEATQRALEDALIAEALKAFRARADAVTKALQKNGWTIVSINIGGGGFQPPPMPMMRATAKMEMAADTVAPSFEGGTSKLRMDVNGTIELE